MSSECRGCQVMDGLCESCKEKVRAMFAPEPPTPDDARTKLAKELYAIKKRGYPTLVDWEIQTQKVIDNYFAQADHCLLREKRAALEELEYAMTVCGLLNTKKHALQTRRVMLEQDIRRLESKQEPTK